ncbi:hypothetical protein BDF20DRAFT_899227 [Mycotypha africana]|uniref:uncharacterized protein n=1 Tax=Mycotypha africana TaxID=64632 RepID=UPI002301E536|nr:uncharacterized protein BDF20DRAFT_899227 [Mycotypha africana]KAI8967785.1 hypothetical protein BDF20DRAFT_899227 [Mycotypha africana]
MESVIGSVGNDAFFSFLVLYINTGLNFMILCGIKHTHSTMKFLLSLVPLAAALLILVQAAPTTTDATRGHASDTVGPQGCHERPKGEYVGSSPCDGHEKDRLLPAPSLEKRRPKHSSQDKVTPSKTVAAYDNDATDIITITAHTIDVPTEAPDTNTMFIKNPEPTEKATHIVFHLGKEQTTKPRKVDAKKKKQQQKHD